MVDIAIMNLTPDQFKEFEKDHKKYIGHGITKDGSFSYISIEFRCFDNPGD